MNQIVPVMLSARLRRYHPSKKGRSLYFTTVSGTFSVNKTASLLKEDAKDLRGVIKKQVDESNANHANIRKLFNGIITESFYVKHLTWHY